MAVSRARCEGHSFTNDAETLGWELSRDVSHSSALEQLSLKPSEEGQTNTRAATSTIAMQNNMTQIARQSQRQLSVGRAG